MHYASGSFDASLTQSFTLNGQPLTVQPTTVFNPAVAPDTEVLEYRGIPFDDAHADVQRIYGGTVNKSDVLIIRDSDIKSYNNAMIEAARVLRMHSPQFLLVPLRGGERPARVIDALLNHTVAFEPFGFTKSRTNPSLDGYFKNELRTILAAYSAMYSGHLRFGSVDCGIGGDGTNKLARWLSELHAEMQGVWKVQMHVFYTPRDKRRFLAAQRQSHARLSIDVRPHEVNNLLGEDFDAVLGRRFDPKLLTYREVIAPGAVFVSRESGVSTLYAADSAATAIAKVISDIGTEHMFETLPRDPGHDKSSLYHLKFGPQSHGGGSPTA